MLKYYHWLQFYTQKFLCCKILYIYSAVIEIYCWNLNCTKIREIISNDTCKCYQWVEVLSSTAILHSKFLCCKINLPNGEKNGKKD